MKLKIFILAFFSFLVYDNYSYADNTKEEIIIIEDQPAPQDPKSKPRMPVKNNVEGWLDGNIMTIIFNNPEGETMLTLKSTEGFIIEELNYSTEAPIVIDLTPYEEVTGFTLTTQIGNTYIGHIYQD